MEILLVQHQTSQRTIFKQDHKQHISQSLTGSTFLFLVKLVRQNNIASVTSSLNAFWGSGIVVPNRGFLLNNFAAFTTVPKYPGRRQRISALPPDDLSIGAYRVGTYGIFMLNIIALFFFYFLVDCS